MIRFFDWRDVGLVKTLADSGVCLDSETGLTQGNHPLQHALLSYLMPMAGAPTLIWRADGDHTAVFGQLSHRQGESHARVLYMAPVAEANTDGWQQLIERLALEAGERRAQNLIAEVDEKSPESEALRQAGFAIYARQTLWKLASREAATKASQQVDVRPAVRADTSGVNTLYSNVVPRLVQQVEPGPQHIERGYVLEEGASWWPSWTCAAARRASGWNPSCTPRPLIFRKWCWKPVCSCCPPARARSRCTSACGAIRTGCRMSCRASGSSRSARKW